MSISNVKVTKETISIFNAETKATGRVFKHFDDEGITMLTFTAPKNGGTQSPEDWAAFNLLVAKHGVAQSGKKVLDAKEYKLWSMSNADFAKLQKKSGKEAKAARQEHRTAAQRKVGKFIGQMKAKAETNDNLKIDKPSNTKGLVKPIQQRVNIKVNDALKQIANNASKESPQHLKNAAKVKALLVEIANLTK